MPVRVFAAVLVLVPNASTVAADWAAKAEAADPPAELTEPVRAALGKDAIRVTDPDGNAVLTVWFRPVVPVTATADQVKNGVTYREVAEGTLVGAVRFDRPFLDYRKQTIPAGVYTLRFAVQPDVGDHTGTSPHPEFLLLTPAAKDSTADVVEAKQLREHSAKATGGDHPGVMLLFPATGKAAGPAIEDRPDGVKVLVARRPVEGEGGKAELGFALTVAGHSKAR